MKKSVEIVFILLMVFAFGSLLIAQNVPAEESKKDDKGKEIINLAQKTIYQQAAKDKIKAINYKAKGIIVANSIVQIEGSAEKKDIKSAQDIEENISIELFDKTNYTVFAHDSYKNPIENFTKVTMIFDGVNLSSKTDTVRDGKRVDIDLILASPNVPESTKKQIRESQEREKKQLTKDALQKSILSKLFPLLLYDPWGNGREFTYIGKADAGEIKADILELKTDTGQKTRYFFNDKTHLLLMITEELFQSKLKIKTSYFFSNYQLMSGMMIAGKVNAEIESEVNQEVNTIDGKKIATSISKINSEINIQEFKINPVFKADTFTIKGK